MEVTAAQHNIKINMQNIKHVRRKTSSLVSTGDKCVQVQIRLKLFHDEGAENEKCSSLNMKQS